MRSVQAPVRMVFWRSEGSEMSKATHIVVIDTETTGFSFEKGDRLLEVAAARYRISDMVFDGEFAVLCAEGEDNIGSYHAEMGTFRDADWSAAKPRIDAIRDLFAAMSGQIVVGKNIQSFDMPFLKHEAKLHGLPFPKVARILDLEPMLLPLLIAGEVPDLKLESVRTWAGCKGKQAHRALGDVRDTFAVLDKFLLIFGAGMRASKRDQGILDALGDEHDFNVTSFL